MSASTPQHPTRQQVIATVCIAGTISEPPVIDGDPWPEIPWRWVSTTGHIHMQQVEAKIKVRNLGAPGVSAQGVVVITWMREVPVLPTPAAA